jgi:hypothetical protein
MFDGYWWMPFKRNRLAKIISQPGGSVLCDDTTSVARIFDSRLSYAKGAIILHQLRWILGDSVFFTAINNYLQDPLLAYGFARTPDLIAHLESVSGRELGWYFDDWYTGQGFPSYQVSWFQEESEMTITVNQTTSHPSVSFFALPLPFRIKNNDRDTLIRLDHAYSGESFTINLPFQADSLLLDPDLWLISANNSVTAIPGPDPGDKIKVFPNPATHRVVIDFAERWSWHDLTLQDISGRVVLTREIAGQRATELDLHTVPAGYYVILLQSPDRSATLPLIIH